MNTAPTPARRRSRAAPAVGIAAILLIGPLAAVSPAAAEPVVEPAAEPAADPSPEPISPDAAFRVEPAGGGANVALAAAGGSVTGVSSELSSANAGDRMIDGAVGRATASSTWLAADGDGSPWATLALARPYLVDQVRLRTAGNHRHSYDTAQVGLLAGGTPVDQLVVVADPATTMVAVGTAAARTTAVDALRVDLSPGTAWRTGLGEVEILTGQVGGREVRFFDASTDDGAVVAWHWDFGDGATSAEQHPVHTYAAAGEYTVNLWVTDDQGNSSTVASHSQTVLDPDPVTLVAPTEIDEGGYVTVTDATAHTGPRAAAAREWAATGMSLNREDEDGATFAAVDSGRATVELTLTDSAGLVSTGSHAVTVRNVAPWASLRLPNSTIVPGVPHLVDHDSWDASAADREGLTCRLDPGDGRAPIDLANCLSGRVEVTYATAGRFTQTLTVTDPDGAVGTATAEVEVVKQATYLNLHPVPGTVTEGGATLRVRLWNAALHRAVEGATVALSGGGVAQDVVTGADGTATVRVAAGSGVAVTATFAGDEAFAGATDTETLDAGARTPADVFFMIDESGSMGGYQENVKRNVSHIVDELAKTLDPQVGVGGFGDSGDLYLPHVHVPATNKLDDVRAALDTLTVNGGTEPGLDAVLTALRDGGMREGSGQCVVLIGDEATQSAGATVQEVRDELAAREAHLFSIVSSAAGAADYRQLATNSGGQFFDIHDFGADPQPVLDALLEGCATAVLARPDLSVATGDGTDVVRPGGTLSPSILATNDGEVATTGTVLTATLPEGVTDIEAGDGGVLTPAGPGAPRAVVTWDLGTLEPGATAAPSLRYRVPAETPLGTVLALDVAVADDGSQGGDLTPANNAESDATTVHDDRPGPPSVGRWYLTDGVAGIPQDLVTPFEFGPPTSDVYMGDWNGDGVDTPAHRANGNEFHVRNSNDSGTEDEVMAYGQADDVVYVGDWDGDGVDTFAVRRGNRFLVANDFSGGEADVVFHYGRPDDEVVIGDWDGDGRDSITVRRANAFHVRDTLTTGNATHVFWYGRAGEPVLVGDWDGDGTDTPAIRRGTQVHVRDTLTTGNATQVTDFGAAEDLVLVGRFRESESAADTLGIHVAEQAGQ